jgi:hypothetical protein
MSALRDEFRAFLLRVAENDLRPDDWSHFAVNHFADEEMESLRRKLVEKSNQFPELQLGWIPRELSQFAWMLAEYLRPQENAIYWTERYDLEHDGTLTIKTTWSDGDTHSVGESVFSAQHADYQFWLWIIDDESRRKGLKHQSDVESLRVAFQKSQHQ